MCICMCVVFVSSGLKRVLLCAWGDGEEAGGRLGHGGMLRLWFPADGWHARTSQRPGRRERNIQVEYMS